MTIWVSISLECGHLNPVYELVGMECWDCFLEGEIRAARKRRMLEELIEDEDPARLEP